MIEFGKTETIVGIYLKTIIRDWESGYTVFVIQRTTDQITCSGIILTPRENVKVEVTGVWKNTKYGVQLSDCSLREMLHDPEVMLELLRRVPTVGEATAKLIVTHFGAELYDIAARADALRRLTAVPGVSKKRAEAIIAWLKENEAQSKLFEYLSAFGGSFHAASKIYKKYSTPALEKLRADPYKVGSEAGLSYKVCDIIAQDSGIKPYDERRIIGVLNLILSKEANAGNSYMPYSEVLVQAKKVLGVTPYTESIAAACIGGVIRSRKRGFVLDNDNVYLDDIYRQERRTAFAIKRLLRTAIKTEFDLPTIVADIEKKCEITYDEKQKEAFRLLATGGIGIITGGPGTGKTSVIKGLLIAYRQLHPNSTIRLCAPTGRASQRMKESTGMEATTTHRILECRPFENSMICKNESNPIDADFLVVDECSMISIDIAEMLFSAIRNGTTVILTGDTNQLPAVGAGNVLHDLIHSGIIPVVALTKTFRQAGESAIITNAKRIREGITKLKQTEEFEIIEADNTEIPLLVKEKFLKYNLASDNFSCQVLTPSRKKYATSSNMLNQTLQDTITPPLGESIKFGAVTYRVGDRVMFMHNNYESGYFNGDIGVVDSIQENAVIVKLDSDLICVKREDMDDLSLAFATTVHKAQGSEYDTVIVVLPSEPRGMLRKDIFYTAITRARKKVIVIAAEGTISRSIYEKNAAGRKSGLLSRLQEN